MPLHPAEDATIRAFILRERQPRYLEQLADPQHRARFLDRLNHCRDFDSRFATSVRNLTAGELFDRGAPNDCRLVSAAAELDGLVLPLPVALSETIHKGWGTILCCLPGRLAYYRDEQGAREFLLVRDASA